MAIKRVMNRKVHYEGLEFDSSEELRYYILLLDDKDVSCIHRQVRLCLIKPLYVLVPKALKTKVKWVKRSLVKGITTRQTLFSSRTASSSSAMLSQNTRLSFASSPLR